MMPAPDPGDSGTSPDLDALVADLRARVEERRKSGEYPPGLEEDLSRHVDIILRHRREQHPSPDLRGPLGQAAAAVPRGPAPPAVDSKVPGGATLHATVARLVGRHTQGLSQQMTAFGDPVVATLVALVEAVEGLAREVQVDVAAHLEAIYERQAAQERVMTRAGLDVPPWTPPSSGP